MKSVQRLPYVSYMFRISQIIETLSDKKSAHQFYFESIATDYSKPKNIIKLIKEVYKLIKATTFLMFWDRESPILD